MSHVGPAARRQPITARTRFALVAIVATAMLGSVLTLGFVSNDAAAVPPPPVEGTVCYSLDEGTGDATEDQQFLHEVALTPAPATKVAVNLSDPAGNIEGIALRNDTAEIYVYDPAAGAMFTINGDTGAQTPAVDYNLTGLGDIDAMFFQNDTDGDPTNDILWVLDDGITNPGFDSLTGYNPDGTVAVATIPITNVADPLTIEGATWVPDTGEFLISYVTTGVGDASTLASLGTGTVPSGTAVDIGTNIADVEGLGTDGAGNVYLTSGEDPGPPAQPDPGPDVNTLFAVDPADASTTELLDLSVGAPAGGDADFESVDCAFPGINLTKAVSDGPTQQPDGYAVSYTFVITNDGVLPLDNVTLTDPVTEFAAAGTVVSGPTPNPAGDCSTEVALGTQSLAIGESCTAVWDFVFDVPPAASYNNTATVEGTPPNGIADTTSADASATVIIPADPIDLVIVKTAVPLGNVCPTPGTDGLDTIEAATGTDVTYCITVTNNGPGDAQNVVVTDDLNPLGDNTIGDLAAGASFSYEYVATVGANPETNTATVNGQDLDGVAGTPDSDQAGTTEPPAEGIDLVIVKTVVPAGTTCPVPGTLGLDTIPAATGSLVTYCITVTNNGPGDAQNVVVTDDLNPAGNATIGNLAAGASDSYEYTATVGANPETNTATVNGENLDGVPGTPASDDAGTTEPPAEAIDLVIVKTAVPAGSTCPVPGTDGLDTIPVASGSLVTYCITVTNNGPGDAQNVVVTDDLNPAGNATIGNLAAGASDSYQYTATVGANPETNTATVNGENLDGVPGTPDSDDAGTTEPPPQGISLSIVKTVVPAGATCPIPGTTGLDLIEAATGSLVTYCITVTNNGPGDAQNVVVTDDLNPAGNATIGNLAAGASDSYEYTATVGTNPETNTATVNGDDLAGNPGAPASDDAGTTEPAPDPVDLVIVKTVVPAGATCPVPGTTGLDTIVAATGSLVTYCITVTNNGPGAAQNVVVTDDLNPAGNATIGDLAAGASDSYQYTATVGANPEINTATVNGEDLGGTAATPSSDQAGTTEPVPEAIDLVIVKTVVPAGSTCPVPGTDGLDTIVAATGSLVTYCISVTNNGPGDAQNVLVTDDLNPAGNQSIPSLAAGETVSYEYTATVGTNPETNTATVTGEDLGGTPGAPDSDDAGTTEPVVNTVKIGDTVFEDLNQNGIQDAGEPGIAGVTVQVYRVDAAGNPIVEAGNPTEVLTDANGMWMLDVLPDTYRIAVVLPEPGAEFTIQDAGGDDALDSDVANSGPTFGFTDVYDVTVDNPTIDAGIILPPDPAELGDLVFEDTNANGQQDPGEPGIPGVGVQLLDGAGNPVGAPITTDANGEYLFTDLAPGDYQVVFINTTNGTFTTQNVGDDATDSDADAAGATPVVTLGSGESNRTIDAGIVLPEPLGSISNFVFEDTNEDGIQDLGEPGVSNVTVNLLDGAGNLLSSTTTDASGQYIFGSLPAGDYIVEFVAPVGRDFTTQDAGDDTLDSDASPATGQTAVISLGVGEDNVDVDAGILPPPELGSISNFVFEDTNQDGLQDAGEPPVPAVTVNLLDDMGTLISSTTTDATGQYLFDNLPAGDYIVQFVAPAGRDFTAQDAGDDTLDSDADTLTGETAVIPLAEGEDNVDVDAGLLPVIQPQLGSISNFVFEDTNQNGLQDAGEAPVPAVTVNLLDGNGTLISSTTTDATGQYLFDNLPAGDYIVEFVAPVGRDFTAQDAGDDTLDSDAAPADGRTAVIPLAEGEDNVDVDAGLLPPVQPPLLGSISNFVFEDTNQNGVQDAGEAPVPAVTVNLLDGNGTLISSTTTDTAGEYLFANLPAGDYIVEFVAPPGRDFTTPDAGDDTLDSDAGLADGRTGVIPLAAGEDNVDVDAGLLPPVQPPLLGSISNFVFEDTNQNGLQDAGEAPVPAVMVNLLSGNGTLISSTMTDATGQYLFDNLPAGDYIVEFVAPAGRDFTAQDAGDDTLDSDASPATGQTAIIPLAAGEDNVDVDAGLLPPVQPPLLGSISNLVFEDTNQNGVQDAGEPPVPAVTVNLLDGNGTLIASTTTDAGGEYIFESLPAGDYIVEFVAPAGRDFTTQDTGGDDTIDSDAAPADGRTAVIPLAAGEDNVDVDAGLLPPVAPPLLGSISNFVFEDTNQDGVQDAGEPGIQAVTVNLLDGQGTLIASTTTSATGQYLFDNLPAGDYIVEFVAPAGRELTVADAGGDDTLDSDASPVTGRTAIIPLAAGENNVDVDAGVLPLTPPPLLGSISNFVFEDTNQNGVQDAGEPGILAVTVNLLDPNGTLIASTTTDANGEYLFENLPAGDYIVEFVAPVGRDFTTPDGGDDAVDSDAGTADGRTGLIPLAAGEDNDTVDAGILPPVLPPEPASISNVVFEDTNNNGIQDPGEPGIPAVTVNLLNGNGVLISTTTTNADGEYLFANLPAGDYIVEFVAPAGRDFTTPDTGADDTVDSDAGIADGRTPVITLVAGEDNDTVDAGIVPPPQPLGSISDTVFGDSNGNGIQDAGESGVAGVTVTLLDSDGNVISTTTTAADGSYMFADLPAGDYIIEFTAPAGTILTDANQGADDALDSDADPATGQTGVITLGAGENNDSVDAGLVELGSISNVVFQDTNENGIQDAGESGVAGVVVTATDTDGNVVATSTTAADGSYLLDNLPPGDYVVTFTLPSGLDFTDADAGADDTVDSDADPATGQTGVITVGAGENITTVDAGVVGAAVTPSPTPTAACFSNDGTAIFDASACPAILPLPSGFSNVPAVPQAITEAPDIQPAEGVELAFTGTSSAALAAVALTMLTAGGALLISVRRRNDDI